MSQAGIVNTSSAPVPPAVPTSFQTDVNSPSVPVGNLEKVFGGQISVDNANGIRTDGSSGSNTLTVQLTNRFQLTTTTSDATPFGIQFILPATAGTYLFTSYVVAYNQTDTTGATFTLTGSVRSTGAATVLLNSTDKISNIEGTPGTWDATIGVAALNSIVITVTGLAGKAIKWNTLTNFVFVSST